MWWKAEPPSIQRIYLMKCVEMEENYILTESSHFNAEDVTQKAALFRILSLKHDKVHLKMPLDYVKFPSVTTYCILCIIFSKNCYYTCV